MKPFPVVSTLRNKRLEANSTDQERPPSAIAEKKEKTCPLVFLSRRLRRLSFRERSGWTPDFARAHRDALDASLISTANPETTSLFDTVENLDVGNVVFLRDAAIDGTIDANGGYIDFSRLGFPIDGVSPATARTTSIVG